MQEAAVIGDDEDNKPRGLRDLVWETFLKAYAGCGGPRLFVLVNGNAMNELRPKDGTISPLRDKDLMDSLTLETAEVLLLVHGVRATPDVVAAAIGDVTSGSDALTTNGGGDGAGASAASIHEIELLCTPHKEVSSSSTSPTPEPLVAFAFPTAAAATAYARSVARLIVASNDVDAAMAAFSIDADADTDAAMTREQHWIDDEEAAIALLVDGLGALEPSPLVLVHVPPLAPLYPWTALRDSRTGVVVYTHIESGAATRVCPESLIARSDPRYVVKHRSFWNDGVGDS